MNETQPSSAPEPLGNCPANRRREDRYASSGPVEFDVVNCFADQFHGELVEISAHGMRVVHNCLRLERNMLIRFRHPLGSGLARAVWNRRNGTSVESGFEVQESAGSMSFWHAGGS